MFVKRMGLDRANGNHSSGPKWISLHVLVELFIERRSALLPGDAHFFFGLDVDVAGRPNRFRALDFDQDYSLDGILRTFFPVDPPSCFPIDIVIVMHLRASEETIAASRELVDDVDLDERIGSKIRPGVR